MEVTGGGSSLWWGENWSTKTPQVQAVSDERWQPLERGGERGGGGGVVRRLDDVKSTPVRSSVTRAGDDKENCRTNMMRRSVKRKIRTVKSKVTSAQEKLKRVGAGSKTPNHGGLLRRSEPHHRLLMSTRRGGLYTPSPRTATTPRHTTHMYSPFDIISPATASRPATSTAAVTPVRCSARINRLRSSPRKLVGCGVRDLEALAAQFDMKISSPPVTLPDQPRPAETRRQTRSSSSPYTTLPTSCIIWSGRRERLV